MKKRTEYRITYITELNGEEQNALVNSDEELRRITDQMIAKGYYIKIVTEWNNAQNRFMQYKKNYLALYNSRESGNNYIKMLMQ